MFNLPGTRIYVVDDDPERVRHLIRAFTGTDRQASRRQSSLGVSSSGRAEESGDFQLDGSIPEAAVVNIALQMAGQYPDRKILLWLDRQEAGA